VLPHLDALRGDFSPPLRNYRPADVFDQRIEFDHEVESNQALLFPLRRLTTDLAAFLAGRDGGVQRYTLVLEHERCADSEVCVGLLTPERARDAVRTRPRAPGTSAVPAPVRGLRLVARELPPFVPAERDLFDARSQQAVPWTQLRERLRARLGDDAVHVWPCARPSSGTRLGRSTERERPSPPSALPRPAGCCPGPCRCAITPEGAGRPRAHRIGLVGCEEDAPRLLPGRNLAADSGPGFRIAGERGPFMLHGWFA
jgi:protein ImuB